MRRLASAVLTILLTFPRIVSGQDRGAVALGELVQGLGVSARVLVIGAHPDDEDTRLITFLARGRHVETAYLSLTRGDGGQNLIGNELGEALGVIRTEELLAARRIDGARQYFARAYDFGFSKSAEEAFQHWPHDSLLSDVVTVVRAFRPHVIVSVFSGTPRDGHGQHQVAGILAREVYDVSADTTRFPAAKFGPAWTVSKFYRGASFSPELATIGFNVGEYSPLLGRSYAEIAAESRSQHKSQAFGSLQRKGVVMGYVRREATRVNAATDAKSEKSLFDGIDTTLARVASYARDARSRSLLDSLGRALSLVQRQFNPFAPALIVPRIESAYRLAREAGCALAARPPHCQRNIDWSKSPDLVSLDQLMDRLEAAWRNAVGLAVEATVDREVVAIGDTFAVTTTVYNRGTLPITLRPPQGKFEELTVLQPDSVLTWKSTRVANPSQPATWANLMQPTWLAQPRRGDMFAVPITGQPAGVSRSGLDRVVVVPVMEQAMQEASYAIVRRYADPIRGELQRPLAVAPAISITLDQTIALAPANAPLDRVLRVSLRSATTASRDVRVSLRMPAGLAADSAARTVTLPGYASFRTVEFRMRGKLPAGRHTITAVAESNGQTFTNGYVPIEYEHIRPQRLYRDAVLEVQAVDVKLPPKLDVAYIPGVGDNVAPMLEQLGVPLTVLDPASLPSTDLSRFSAVVVGTRAYEASPSLVANNARLLDYARNGGTLVVQYGQYEIQQPGIMPYPITLARPADRVTVESAPVRILAPGSPVLTAPNRITERDFEGWVQDRTYYMPRTFDEHYAAMLSTNDPGEPPNNGAILVAPYGKGTYVYTTLAFFRELPAGVPGAARLFVNILAVDQRSGNMANGASVAPQPD